MLLCHVTFSSNVTEIRGGQRGVSPTSLICLHNFKVTIVLNTHTFDLLC